MKRSILASRREAGATAVEYALMVMLLSLAIFGTVQVLGTTVNAAFAAVTGGF